MTRLERAETLFYLACLLLVSAILTAEILIAFDPQPRSALPISPSRQPLAQR